MLDPSPPAPSLPAFTTPFIGRAAEISRLRALLDSSGACLLTITGPAGVGKTRLAVEAARNLVAGFPDGAYFVDLAPVADPALVVPSIARALSVPESAQSSLWEALVEWLTGKQVLLLLDNFEQVVGAAGQLNALLAVAPRLIILVTSRVALRVYGEQEFPLGPLTQPAGGRMKPEDLIRYEATHLFLRRAHAVQPNLQLSGAGVQAIVEICARLDGLPLALELAAARTRLLSPEALLARLARRLPLLIGGARDLPARHQTLRNAIGWSYDLLAADEQRLFRRLAVFVGGCTIAAIEAVVGPEVGEQRGAAFQPDEPIEVLDVVHSLLDKSLLRQLPEAAAGEIRVGMLETIREFALELLEASGEAAVVRERHAAYFLQLAQDAHPHIRGSDQGVWLSRLEQEHDNLRAVLRGSLEGDPLTGLRVAGVLWLFWYMRGHLGEGRRWLESLLDAAAPLLAAYLGVGDPAATGTEHERSPSGDNTEAITALVRALNAAGNTAETQGDYDAARLYHERNAALARRLADKVPLASALNNLANVVWAQGDVPQAQALYEESLAIKRQLGDRQGISSSLHNLGNLAWVREDYAAARPLYAEALAIRREIGDKRGMAHSLISLGRVALADEQTDQAEALYLESMALLNEIGNQLDVTSVLDGLAAVASRRGQLETAARLWGATEALRAVQSVTLPPPGVRERLRHIEAARGRLEEKRWLAAWSAGMELTLDEAKALALRQPPEGTATAPLAPPETARLTLAAALSAREREVLLLLVAGSSNSEIAERLSLSVNTVQTHLRSIYAKLGVANRASAVRFALQHQIAGEQPA